MNEQQDGSGTSGVGPKEAGEIIRQHEGEIMNEWLDDVAKQVPAARSITRSELANHLLELLIHLTEVMSSVDADLDFHEAKDLPIVGTSFVHARARSSSKEYTLGQMAHEYMLFRQLIVRFLERKGVCSIPLLNTVNSLLDLCIFHAINEFVRVTEEVQQKLVGSIIHDVRTPLSIASNYAEVVTTGSLTADQKARAAAVITRNLTRAVAMLEDVLHFMKQRGGLGLLLRFERTELVSSIRTLCVETSKIYSKEIHCELEDEPVVGMFDMAQVVRAMENLLSNAIKYGYPNTPVTVSLKDHGEYVSLLVHNEGDPIFSEHRNAIFEFFSRTDKEPAGQTRSWGIGLSLIKRVAECHGGEVTLESSEETGTTFGMTLYKEHRAEGEEVIMRI